MKNRWIFQSVPWRAAILAVALVASCGVGWSEPPAPADLIGYWSGSAVHHGQSGEFGFRIQVNEGGQLVASISLPTIDAWDILAVPIRLESDRLSIGPWDFVYGPDEVITGALPAEIVPVYEIPISLYRAKQNKPKQTASTESSAAEPIWTTDLGSPIWAGIEFSEDTVFVGADDGGLRAIDIESGGVRWQFDTGAAIRARPTVAGDALYIYSDDGFLYSLRLSSGELEWKAPIGTGKFERISPGNRRSRYIHYASSAIRVDDTVYLSGLDGAVYALDADSGGVRWRVSTNDTLTSTPALEKGRLFVGSFDGRVYALDATTGAELWKYDTKGAIPSDVWVQDGRVVVGSRSYDLLALDAESGELVWKHYLWYSWVESSVAALEGVLFVGSSDAQQLSSFDAVSGTLRWKTDIGGSVWSQPAVTREGVFVGSVGVADYIVDHQARFVAIDRLSGSELWQVWMPRPPGENLWGFGASPAVGEGKVFVGGLDGRVYAFSQNKAAIP
jgi:outer membrane protein assembly factor BamB